MAAFGVRIWDGALATNKVCCNFVAQSKKQPKYVRYPRRTKLPAEPRSTTFRKKKNKMVDDSLIDSICGDGASVTDQRPTILVDDYDLHAEEKDSSLNLEHETVVWDADEVEAISSLFQGRIPQKPGKPAKQRPLPLALPYKLRPLGLPTTKRRARSILLQGDFSSSSLPKQLFKDPMFLIYLARQIQNLPTEEDASTVLSTWGRFLRKGSLSLTIRELGHMGLPDRVLQTFSWAQSQTHLFPDDRILASAVEVLAGSNGLKFPFNPVKFVRLGSQVVVEAITRGFIRGQRLDLALKLVSSAKHDGRMLDSGIYTVLILELGKNLDKHEYVTSLLEELAGRDDLNLNQMECTTIMKISARHGRYELVDGLFNWFKNSGRKPTVVMYTTVIHSLYSEMKLREAMALVWEMETANCVLDLPAYRVVIKLFVALNDLSRAVRYFSKLKEAGLSPSYDIYMDMFRIYAAFGRLAKCKEVCKDADLAGFTLKVTESST